MKLSTASDLAANERPDLPVALIDVHTAALSPSGDTDHDHESILAGFGDLLDLDPHVIENLA
jgi:hypothetical protein